MAVNGGYLDLSAVIMRARSPSKPSGSLLSVLVIFLMVLFGWMGLVGLVRAEFLRARNFEYVRAAKALGVSDWQIMFRHPFFKPHVETIRMTFHGLRGEKGDPHEGIKIDFVNPVTGEPVFRTLNYSAQLLRPGEETELKRETAGTYYVVIEGTGATEVGGKRFEWGHNDLFVVPNFLWRRHINTGKTDAVIYSVSDAALMRNIGQYYAQGRAKDGKVTELVH